jgi:hypothetical protein
MFFIITELINKNTYVKNLYTQIVEVAKVVKIIPIYDIELGIKTDIKNGYEWDFKIPEYFSSQEELDKLV